MRRQVIATVAALSTLNLFAQGVLNFANKTNAVDAPVLGPYCQGGPLGWPGYPWLAELYYGSEGAPECLLKPIVQLPIISGGYFNAGAIVIPGFLPGQTITAQVRVWDFTAWPSWEQAALVTTYPGSDLSNFIGASPPFQVTLAGPGEPPADLIGLESFCMNGPEFGDLYPSLDIRVFQTNTLVFSWVGGVNDHFFVQRNPTLDPARWVTLTNVPWTDWVHKQLAISRPEGAMFYRLISQR